MTEKQERLLRMQSELMKVSTKAKLRAQKLAAMMAAKDRPPLVCPFVKDPLFIRLDIVEI